MTANHGLTGANACELPMKPSVDLAQIPLPEKVGGEEHCTRHASVRPERIETLRVRVRSRCRVEGDNVGDYHRTRPTAAVVHIVG